MQKKIYIVYLFIHFIFFPCQGQPFNYNFKAVFEETELSRTRINCIFQDSRGYLWLGSQIGLYRYDGYNLTPHRANPADTNAINANNIKDIVEDDKSNLWIATYGGGLNKYNSHLEIFTSFVVNDNKNSIPDNYINTVAIDNDGLVWVGCRTNGLSSFDPKTGKFENYLPISEIKDENGITSILCDSQNNIWFSGYKSGLFRVIRGNNVSFINYTHNESNPNSISDNDVWAICEDHNKNIWVGAHVLNKFDKESENFIRYPYLKYNKNIDTRIQSITLDNQNNGLWLGTGMGVVFSKFLTGGELTFHFFNQKENNIQVLKDKNVYSLYQDPANNLWAGTQNGVIKGREIIFNQYKPEKSPEKQPANIMSIAEDEKQNVWISSWDNGIYRYKADSQNRCLLTKVEKIPGDFAKVWTILPYRDNLLIGTWGKGLGKITYKQNKYFTNWFTEKTQTSIVVDLNQISANKIWVGGWSSDYFPLYQYIPDNNIVRHDNFGNNKKNSINDILEGTSGNLWIATQGYGLLKVNNIADSSRNKEIISFTYEPNETNSISDDLVNTLYEDARGNIWAGTENGGICQFIRDNSKPTGYLIKNYTVDHGLPDNHIMAITGLGNDELWISTRNGLSKFSISETAFYNFSKEEGLSGNEFNVRAYWKTHDNRLYFGGKKGFTVFYPDSIKKSQFIPNVVITGFYLFNNKIEPSSPTKDGRILFNKSLHNLKKIKLTYKDDIISFEFASLDFTNPKKNKYLYRLKRFDKQWHTTNGKKRYITYTNLSPGKYTFQVKGSNSDGVWNKTPASLIIEITPPYWQTMWFKFVIVSFIVLSIYISYLLRVHNLRQVNKRLGKEVKERTKKIEQQNEVITKINNELLDERNKILFQSRQLAKQNEALKEANMQLEKGNEIIEKKNKLLLQQREEIEKMAKEKDSINQMKLRFFTNISHEFRTPLTLISSPLKKLLQEYHNNQELFRQLLVINKNAEKLLRLINQLIEFRRLEAGKVQLKVKQDNIHLVVQEAFDSFYEYARQYDIAYHFHSFLDDSIFYFDSEKIDIMLYNLLSNAFKFTAKGGKISLTLSLARNDFENSDSRENRTGISYLKIVVADSGIGIPQAKIEKIFERFYQAHDNKIQSTGTGIGLSMVRDLVELHHGKIQVESIIQGKETSDRKSGTSFTIWLPADKEIYKPEEIIEHQSMDEQVVRKETEFYQSKLSDDKNQKKNETNKSGTKILIVDDNLDLLEYLINYFSKAFRVFSAKNGLEAYEQALENQPAVIISDIMMPEMDGIELCKKLKANDNTSHIPIILLTAKNAIEHRLEGLSVGADAYIPKPFDPNHLEIRVNKLIEFRNKLIEKFSKQVLLGPDKVEITHADELFIRELTEKLDKNLNKTHFSIDFLASEMNISRRQLYRKMKVLTDISLGDFIRNFRLQKAAQLLKQSGLSIAEIAYEVGFKNPKHFSKSFKNFYGVSPSAYLKKS